MMVAGDVKAERAPTLRHATRRASTTRPTRSAAHLDGARVRGVGGPLGGWHPGGGPLLSMAQRDWLSRGGALTRHLAGLGRVSVDVVRETVTAPWPDEARAIGVSLRTRAWVREVVLRVDGRPVVAAHSITSLPASRATWKAMRALRARPLADLLYADPTVRRSALVSRRFRALPPDGGRHGGDVIRQLACCAVPAEVTPGTMLVARRSVFERGAVPLMITECFLPGFWSLLKDKS